MKTVHRETKTRHAARIKVALTPPSKLCVTLGCNHPVAKRCDYFCTLHCCCRARVTP